MNPNAEAILDALRAATSAEECEAASARFAREFADLQKSDPVRAIHVVNLAKLKRKQFEQARERANREQGELWG